ncbi:MAG: HAD family phosphatase, partial [Muribaculaceae bacterium]
MNNIKNLLFDLGGVIIDINRDRCVEAYTRAGMRDANEMLGVYKQSGIFLQLEEGSVTPEEFRAEIRRHFDCEV